MLVKFYNEYHLGDHVLHIHYCRKLVDQEKCQIIFYIPNQYISDMSRWLSGYEDNIQLLDISQMPRDGSVVGP